jgi:A/G-specific adenine glycosylase
MPEPNLGAALLDWYDDHARDLPWRVGPAARAAGIVPDPYRVWLSEVMLQQTTVATVTRYYVRFTALWPRLADLAAAPEAAVMAEWAGLGYYSRARNLIACARAVMARHGGVFPDTAAELRRLPGIGPYTAAAIAAIAFDRAEAVVDGNVERVMARLFAVPDPLPAAKPALCAHADRLTPRRRPGDHAQALMDLGATICTPKSPACGICPLAPACAARAVGIAAELPRKAPKPPKPVRHGVAYVGRRADGALLVERRPDRGLLGGMLGWPGCDWRGAPADPPAEGAWRDAGAEVRHSFTHFHLRLRVMVADLPARTRPARGFFVPAHSFRPGALPTAMRKAWDVARGQFAATLPD